MEGEPRIWRAEDSERLYSVNRWGQGYFGVDDQGEMVVCRPFEDGANWRISDLLKSLSLEGIEPPVILRFPELIGQRIAALATSFAEAISSFSYQGNYTPVFPVKVNQHAEVLNAVKRYGASYGIGLESGSKAELLTVIAYSDSQTPLICNGFKDTSIVEMAVRAAQLGRRVILVIEKATEVELIARCLRKIDVDANLQLGIRVKLVSSGSGHWQDSVGMNSKFGLTVPELVESVERLTELNLIDRLKLLHFHPGSQINDVRVIKSALVEATRIYCNLARKGAPLTTIDVGGGLAVDYTGNQNKTSSSMNYSLEEYANDVVYYIAQVCDQEGVGHPDLVTESGRAMVAHHAVLVAPVIDATKIRSERVTAALHDRLKDPALPLVELREIFDELTLENLRESFHDAEQAIEVAWQLFANGMLSLEQRSIGERLFAEVCGRICDLMDQLEFLPRELDCLREKFPDKYFVNLNVFRSLPDHWGIEQLFPIVPISRLNERPTRYAVFGDITCDSDGTIDSFIGDEEAREAIPMHRVKPGEPYYLGLFLTGAYQEALGGCHNLLGKVHIATFESSRGLPAVRKIHRGETVSEVVAHADHCCHDLLQRVNQQVEEAIDRGRIESPEGSEIRAFFESIGDRYTYLSAKDPDRHLESNGAETSGQRITNLSGEEG